MALRITNVTRVNGPACDHIDITVNHEGVTRTKRTSFAEVDALLGDMTPAERGFALVMLWAKYRREAGRAVLNVDIA